MQGGTGEDAPSEQEGTADLFICGDRYGDEALRARQFLDCEQKASLPDAWLAFEDGARESGSCGSHPLTDCGKLATPPDDGAGDPPAVQPQGTEGRDRRV